MIVVIFIGCRHLYDQLPMIGSLVTMVDIVYCYCHSPIVTVTPGVAGAISFTLLKVYLLTKTKKK